MIATGTQNRSAAFHRRKGSYGIDAPYLLPIPLILMVVNIANAIIGRTIWPLIAAALIGASMACGLYASRRGKFIVWAERFEQLRWRGDEQILDLGCGRGAVLLLAAQHLTTGRAIGVDLWRKADQSGNAEEVTRKNAVVEGVADRVALHTADMANLPFEDNTFDLVLSSLAIHNIRGRVMRRKAIQEAVRVLRPGGRLMLADIFSTQQYQSDLAEFGMKNITRRNLGWRLWWSGPWLPTYLVTATSPDGTDQHAAEHPSL